MNPKTNRIDSGPSSLLRAGGFYDIELVHGVSEYGRDFIAKRRDDDGPVRQYSLQSKAGDLHLADWRKVREQLEDIRTVAIAHPLFDPSLEGTIVLVTTGSLKGDARGAAKGYGETLSKPWRFELWTGERLIHMLKEHLHTALGERARGPLLSLLGAIDQGDIDLQGVERHTRRWIPEEGKVVAPTDVLEAALIANRLQRTDRLDLACSCALGVLRAEMVAYAEQVPLSPDAAANIQAAGEFFALYAEAIWARCGEAFLHPAPLVNAHSEPGFWATYPVRCVRLGELLALLALWRLRRGRAADDITEWLARFLQGQPGCAHPVSDRYAVSFLAPALLLAGVQRSSPHGCARQCAGQPTATKARASGSPASMQTRSRRWIICSATSNTSRRRHAASRWWSARCSTWRRYSSWRTYTTTRDTSSRR